MLTRKYLLSAAAGALAVTGVGVAAISFADTSTTVAASATPPQGMHQPGVGGTVTAVNGNTITVTGMDGKTYTIDATGASITKDETVAVSDIQVGDTIGAMGTVSGTSVTATNIHDGKMPPMGPGWKGHGRPNDNDADDAPTGTSTTAPATSTTTQ